MALPFKYSYRSVWVRRGTAFATTLGIALVVFVLAGSQMLAYGVQRTLGFTGSRDKVIVLQQSAYSEPSSRLRQGVLGVVASSPGVRSVGEQPLVAGEAVVQTLVPSALDESRVVSVLIRGIGPRALELRPSVRVVEGRPPQPGTDEAMVGRRLLGRFRGLELGGSIELKPGRPIRVVGAFDAQGSAYDSEIWADLDAVRSSLGSDGYVSSVTVQLADSNAFDALARDVKARTNDEAVAERESSYYARISSRMSAVITALGGLVALIFSFGAMLGAAITMYAAVEQRTKEIGVFRALGFNRAHVLLALLMEAGVLALLGAGLGLVLALSLSRLEFATFNGATATQIAFDLQPSWSIALGSVGCGIAVGLLGGVFPALKAARMDPLDALRA
ncbi:MAG TPA: ABC transporter permease [Polyangiaceae bacterium]|nr:ABC transporter permease [Polyangiaceae bacterium]